MRLFMIATEKDSGDEVIVNPNEVVLNAAGSNMTVGTHKQKALDIGDKRPYFQSFRTLKFLPNDFIIMEQIYKEELKKQKKRKRVITRAVREYQKKENTNAA